MGGKTPAQIALNWIISKNRMVFPIPRVSKPERIIENVGQLAGAYLMGTSGAFEVHLNMIFKRKWAFWFFFKFRS